MTRMIDYLGNPESEARGHTVKNKWRKSRTGRCSVDAKRYGIWDDSASHNEKSSWKKLLTVIVVLLTVVILAGNCRPAYAGDPIRKFGRGVTNIATGWLEVFKEIGLQVEKSGDMAGLFVGPFKGIAKAIGRTAVGIYDVVTFLIPVPGDYEPLIEPEFLF